MDQNNEISSFYLVDHIINKLLNVVIIILKYNKYYFIYNKKLTFKLFFCMTIF